MNVVFDIGDVLLRWDPEAYLGRCFPELPAARVAAEVFRSDDWYELDAGRQSRTQAIANLHERTGLAVAQIEALFHGMPKALEPIPETIQLAAQLQRDGHQTYLLSNIPAYVSAWILREHKFLRRFDGALFSHEITQLKPDPQMYTTLLERYRLKAANTLFIDDQPRNLAAAAAQGIATVQMSASSAAAAARVVNEVVSLLRARSAR